MIQRYVGCVVLLHLVMQDVGLGEDRFVKRHTLKELRDQYVVKQRYDYSCAAAALATLMTYYFGDPTSERDILEELTAQLTQENLAHRKRSGLSLLDLKHIAQTKGYQAAGFQLTLEQLRHLAAPVIVFVEPQGYKHFAVLRGIDRGHVLLADPARGNLCMSTGRFLREWNGIVFVLGKAGEKDVTPYSLGPWWPYDQQSPLAIPQFYSMRPALLKVGHMVSFGAFVRNLAIRSRLR